MADGHFSRHLNRMRKIYKRKLQTLTEALVPYTPSISFSGDEAGMHIIVTVHTDKSEQALTEVARKANIRLYGLNSYRTVPVTGEPSFLIGFGGLSVDSITDAVDSLMTVWGIRKGSKTV